MLLAATYETDRRDTATLPIITAMIETFRHVELLEADQTTAIGRVAGKRVAHEPAWKDRRSDVRRRPARVANIERRRAQLWIAACRQAVVVLEPEPQ